VLEEPRKSAKRGKRAREKKAKKPDCSSFPLFPLQRGTAKEERESKGGGSRSSARVVPRAGQRGASPGGFFPLCGSLSLVRGHLPVPGLFGGAHREREGRARSKRTSEHWSSSFLSQSCGRREKKKNSFNLETTRLSPATSPLSPPRPLLSLPRRAPWRREAAHRNRERPR